MEKHVYRTIQIGYVLLLKVVFCTTHQCMFETRFRRTPQKTNNSR